jgi:hypothetical protein
VVRDRVPDRLPLAVEAQFGEARMAEQALDRRGHRPELEQIAALQ